MLHSPNSLGNSPHGLYQWHPLPTSPQHTRPLPIPATTQASLLHTISCPNNTLECLHLPGFRKKPHTKYPRHHKTTPRTPPLPTFLRPTHRPDNTMGLPE